MAFVHVMGEGAEPIKYNKNNWLTAVFESIYRPVCSKGDV